MSGPKDKGTRYENRVLLMLRRIWPTAERSAPGTRMRDFSGLPMVMEAKQRKHWKIQEWVRLMNELHGTSGWMLAVASEDLRMANATEVGVLPLADALALYQRSTYWQERYQDLLDKVIGSLDLALDQTSPWSGLDEVRDLRASLEKVGLS